MALSGRVALIVDPKCRGLRGVGRRDPVWIVDTPENRELAEALRARGRDITTFHVEAQDERLENVLAILDTIELHHSDASHSPAYRRLILGLPQSWESISALKRAGLHALALERPNGISAIVPDPKLSAYLAQIDAARDFDAAGEGLAASRCGSELILRYWELIGFLLDTPATERRVRACERRLGTPLPPELRALLLRADGTPLEYEDGKPTYGVDPGAHRFWSAAELRFDEKHQWALVFADHREESWWYGMDLSGQGPRRKGAVYILGAASGPRPIASSFAEFAAHYVRDDDAMYDTRDL